MRYLLDTNACIELLRDQRRGGARSRLSLRLLATPKRDVAVCSIVRAELMYGAEKSGRTAAHLAATQQFLVGFPSLPFDDAAADAYGRIRVDLERRGLPIDANDLLIAAIAVAHGLTLVTHNTAEFSRVSGLNLEDWQ